MVHCVSMCDLVWGQFWEQHRWENTYRTVPLPSHRGNGPVDFHMRFNASFCVVETAGKREIAFEKILDDIHIAFGCRQISVVLLIAGQHSEHTCVLLQHR